MPAIAVITIVEDANGVISTMMEVDQSSATLHERQVGSLMDSAIAAGMRAVCEYLQKHEGAETFSGAAKTMEEAINLAVTSALRNQ